MRRLIFPMVALFLVVAGVFWIGVGSGTSSATLLSDDPAEVGELGPLIPFHKDAIHASLVLTKEGPKICYWMRPTEYRGTDLVNLDGPMGELDPNFEARVYGGFGFSTGTHGLDESVTTRIKEDIKRDNGQCFDLNHPDAFKNRGIFNVAELEKRDFRMNADAFSDAGHSRGLNYNIFCAGNVMLADGRLLFVGGHDKSGNNGIRKNNIFDPKTEKWVDRSMPRVKAEFLDDLDREFTDDDIEFAREEKNTDPSDPSDMKYQRWYPSVVVLPDCRVLILSGTDQDTSLGPDDDSDSPCQSRTENAECSKVRQVVPEVYDPKTDTTIALENARKKFMMYPRAHVVQTGPGKDDWKVAVIGEVEPPDPEEEDPPERIGDYDPYTYNGNTYLLDVLGALEDPKRDEPAENHWELVDTAQIAHDSGASASLVELDEDGYAKSQKVFLFGGGGGADTDDTDKVEWIDYSDRNPQYKEASSLVRPASQNNAVVRPDGKITIIGGATGRGPWENSFEYQEFDPKTGKIKNTVKTTVPRHDHSTALLLPSGEIIAMGGNRTDLMGNPPNEDDPVDTDTGVPVAQVYAPSYLFKGPRPVIKEAPDEISYGESFKVEVSGGSGKIRSVALIRIGPVTHNWDWGNRYVKLWSEEKKDDKDGTLSVQAPAVPGLAVPGYYMLFAVSDDGVPSEAKFVHLNCEEGK